ncbi:NADH-ubiquinone oxidoreductase complex I, 21 kDa subunit-domain-containing protein [Lipomyces oligophaga]|uniref:NADH-ubiquinone oxidoreductase complex I, 21 kDa subunit-domain-containing protein n=1 Tax=Lipomyces oligophaga TaxID=45792 RepID=UPI0034CE30C3
MAEREDEIGPIYQGTFPLIDVDPHFFRVVRYFRPSDYGCWAGFTALAPAIVGLVDYSRFAIAAQNNKDTLAAFIRSARQGATVLGPVPSILFGLTGGFLFAYERSAARFLGLSENSREYKKDLRELRIRARLGKPLYGESQLPSDLQTVSAAYTRYSSLMLGLFPIFNFVNHPYHGVDTAKYYK